MAFANVDQTLVVRFSWSFSEGPLHAYTTPFHNTLMERRSSSQLSVAALLGLIACIAFNFWLFRLGALWGILGLNVTKHVAIAYLCQALGVDRADKEAPPQPAPGSAPAPRL